MRTIWIIIVLAVACSAEAGPWLRPDGEGFMSADSIGSIGRDQGDLQLYSGVFVEYGVREDLTLGLTGGLNQNQDGDVTLYFRKPIQAAGTWVWPNHVSGTRRSSSASRACCGETMYSHTGSRGLACTSCTSPVSSKGSS